MTVGELRERMSEAEFREWAAFYKWEAMMHELQGFKAEHARG